MKSGKPQDQSLAIAYSVKRKAHKKMAQGGAVDPKRTEVIESPGGHGKIIRIYKGQEEKMADGGILDSIKGAYDSAAKKGYLGTKAQVASSKSYAQGGEINESAKSEQRPMPEERGPKTQPIKHPKMVPSSVFSAQLRDEEDHLQESAKVNEGPQIQPPKHDDEEGADRQGPDVDALHMKMMAEGGLAHEMDDQPVEEADEEHHASIAAAIMAKREKMYEGGQIEGSDESQVDLDLNSMEQPNSFYELNEHAALKENYDEDMHNMSQPIDSNEHGDDIESDKHDRIEEMRKRVMSKRSRQ